ncbi:restriction endonuclease subunit S [Syntrophomonas wolfei]|uniref:restriction endonuclease subunit S n=1 Tax=Syntrophomonas wolfei TaxID=863 RepID=UPI0023EFE501|nr:restriction endonuclease subunit S [Syntrophomonas wolfei]
MNKWEIAKLNNICVEKIQTISPKDDYNIEYVDISSIDNQEKKIISYQTIHSKDAPSRAKQILKKNDILVSTVRPNLNAVAINQIESKNVVVGSTGYCVLRCTKNIDVNYLFNYCKSNTFISRLVKLAKGASYPAVSNLEVKNSKIPLPPLETQKQIAKTLDTAAELLAMRKQQLAELDNLIKSIFYDMFGDPVTNEKGWENKKLGDFATLLNGRAYKQNELLKEGKTPVLRVGNFFSNKEWYYSNLVLDESKYCDKGDLLYAWSASFGPKIWNGPRVIYHYHIWKILVSKEINKQFLFRLLQYITENLKQNTHGITMVHLTKSGMEQTEFILPPVEIQIQFAEIVTKIEEQKALVQKAIDETQYLFDSLMNEYFD